MLLSALALVAANALLTAWALLWWFGGVEGLLCAVFRTREIHKPEGLYLRRFYLSPRVRWLPLQVFLHHILLDDDRNLHDHPWDFVSIILRGSYREFVRCVYAHKVWIREKIARPGSALFNRVEHTHRVEIIKPVWSLVIARRPRRKWGFWTEWHAENGVLVEKWTPADVFLDDPRVYDHPEDRL